VGISRKKMDRFYVFRRAAVADRQTLIGNIRENVARFPINV